MCRGKKEKIKMDKLFPKIPPQTRIMSVHAGQNAGSQTIDARRILHLVYMSTFCQVKVDIFYFL